MNKLPVPLMMATTLLLAACSKAPDAAAPAPVPVAAAASDAAADTILTNGRIYTDNSGWSQALAIKTGGIVAVGDAVTVAALQGAGTRVIDLKGAVVLPGLHDMHVHAMGAGRQKTECLLKREATLDELRKTIADCAARKQPGEWITGGRWVNSTFVNEVQNKKLLDDVAPNNPVILLDETAHSSWVNSAAMKIAGLTRDTPNPLNGVIEREASGEPNGLLRESAAALVRQHVPPPTQTEKQVALESALQEMLSYGITSMQDAGTLRDDGIGTYVELADQGRMKMRVKACFNWNYNITGIDEVFESYYARKNFFRRDRITPDCVKIVNDGVPGEGHTAAMLEPYADVIAGDKDDSRKYGIMNVPPAVLKKMVTRFDADGMAMLIHCTGDACARAAVDAIEAARKTNGYSGTLHQVGHSNFNTAVDLKRARALGVSFEYSAYLYYWNGVTRVYHKAIGDERFKRFKPFRESIDAGANTINGSDWPVSPSVNPWLAMETMVTREKPGGGGEKLAPAEAITLKEAIDIYTINPARQFGHADSVGRIAPGYVADLIVLDRNPFEIPITDVHNTRVTTTLIDGEIVWSAPVN